MMEYNSSIIGEQRGKIRMNGMQANYEEYDCDVNVIPDDMHIISEELAHCQKRQKKLDKRIYDLEKKLEKLVEKETNYEYEYEELGFNKTEIVLHTKQILDRIEYCYSFDGRLKLFKMLVTYFKTPERKRFINKYDSFKIQFKKKLIEIYSQYKLRFIYQSYRELFNERIPLV